MDFARSRVAIAVVALASLWLLGWPGGRGVPTSSAQEAKSSPQIWTVPEIGALPDDANGRLVRRGRDLITATYAHIGPEVADPAKRFAGNNLACGNCHLQAGTKKFGIPLFGLFGAFPHYSARLGAQMTIEERLNACMTRSMNGRPLPAGAPEMQALVAFTAANFLHFNMPHGVDYLNPQLSPEQAWDIAAYVVSKPRPHKAGLDKDFPDLLEKPVDAPYGPYADGFSEQQHKYGPFAPIRAAIAKLKTEQKGAPAPR